MYDAKGFRTQPGGCSRLARTSLSVEDETLLDSERKSWAVKPEAHWPMLPYSLAPGKSHEQRRSNPTDRDMNVQSFSSYLLLFPPSPPSCHSGWSSASQLPQVPPCSRIYGFPLPHRMLLSFFLPDIIFLPLSPWHLSSYHQSSWSSLPSIPSFIASFHLISPGRHFVTPRAPNGSDSWRKCLDCLK